MKRFKDETYDLVLLDVLMPEMNGFEIAKEIKKLKPGQKIIMVTGLGEDAAIHQAGTENVPVGQCIVQALFV